MASQDPSQNQNIGESRIENSELQLLQAGRDAIGFQNSHENQVTINNAIVQLFGRSQPASVDWDWAGRVIKEQQAEVRNRLKYVLRDCAPLSLQMSEQPKRVNLPALESERRLTITGHDSELLDPGQSMIEVFRRDDIAGKLLILGTPGAGKTTVLLSLAEQVLIGAINNPKTVIPIVFELSTWKDDNQSIQDWLVEQLYDLYDLPGRDRQRKLKRYEQWLEQRVLLPLLDGLDELGMERQQKCMAKLNEFTRQYPQVVVCCRSKEFEESGIRLGNLRGAIALEPLSDRQIQTYLQQVEREGLWHQIQETPEMRQMLEPNDGEAGLLRVPLFVSLAAAIYDKDQPFRTKGELLERYVDRQLSFDVRMSDRRKGLERRKWAYVTVEKEPQVEVTWHYLAWLAWRLNGINEVNFLVEKMQPRWLEKQKDKYLYRLIFGLIQGLILGLFFGMSLWLLYGLSGGLIRGLRFYLFFGLFFGLGGAIGIGDDINLVESFQIPILNASRREVFCAFKSGLTFYEGDGQGNGLIVGLLPGLSFGLGCGILPGLGCGLVLWLSSGLLFGLMMGLLFGLMIGLLLGLTIGLKQHLKVRSQPNQGVWNSIRNMSITFILVCPFFLVFSLIYSIYFGMVWGLSTTNGALIVMLFSGVLWAISWGFSMGGGLAFIRHFCLRFVLARSGTFPFFCVPFLNYCTERQLLQRIGGRYRFIHRELLEHFAKQGNFRF